MKKKTKEQVRDELHLDQVPDDEFMQLLGEAGEEAIVTGPPTAGAVAYTPEQISEELAALVVANSVGSLLAHARAESGLSLRAAGAGAGVSRGRIQQLESSENVEVATLVRTAEALGYDVRINLTPKRAGMRPLVAELHVAHA